MFSPRESITQNTGSELDALIDVVSNIAGKQGVSYDYQPPSQRAYVSLFGKVQVKRAYYLNADGG